MSYCRRGLYLTGPTPGQLDVQRFEPKLGRWYEVETTSYLDDVAHMVEIGGGQGKILGIASKTSLAI